MLLVLLTACSSRPERVDRPTVEWSRVDLPGDGRLVLRGAFPCGDDLVVLGATAGPEDETAPAAWRLSGDARAPITLEPRRDPYAAEEILTAGACRADGRMSLFGSKAGGAHGMPRSATWRQVGDRMVVARNPFEVFGGPNVGSYGPMAADARQWVLVGTRTTGGAAWTSGDGGTYRLREGVLGPDTHVLDVRRDGERWVAAGFVVDDGTIRPLVWTSGDAVTWVPHDLPSATDGLSEAERLVRLPGGPLVAVGFDGGRVGWWTESSDGWQPGAAIPDGLATLTPGGQAPYVTGVAATSRGLALTFSDGARFRGLLLDGGSWQRLPLPEQVGVSGDAWVAVTAYDDRWALVVDDGREGRLYLQAPAA